VVSGEAEADFEKGYQVNLDGTRQIFEAIRQEGAKSAGTNPEWSSRLASPSSAPRFPDVIGDEFFTTPLTSYGTQKAMDELLLADYSRRGFFEGVGIRLPTICIRPGKAEQGRLFLFLGYSAGTAFPARKLCCRSSEEVRHWHARPAGSGRFFLIHGGNHGFAAR